ncbi:MAG: DNA recombination protein RmuC [Verrucomicrobiota bacterium]
MEELSQSDSFAVDPATLELILVIGVVLIVVLLIVSLAALWRLSGARAKAAGEEAERDREAEMRVADLVRAQAEMQGRMGTLAEVFNTRLDGMSSQLGQSITQQTQSTHENLAKLQERLAVIDTAQSNIESLATEVVELQNILSNKQSRGAFGEGRMEAIVSDALPHGTFEFQATLSNGSRPDCIVKMPNGAAVLVIDAKFPLESWNAIRAAHKSGDSEIALRKAAQKFRRDVEFHLKTISEKYLISGETQDTALMFVPSESIFAEIHENFDDLVQKSHKARVVIVSPSLLMLSIQVIQSVLRDTRMREQANVIQTEVIRLLEDVTRLGERVEKLQTHFGQTNKDLEEIVTSAEKIGKRGRRIEELDFGTS